MKKYLTTAIALLLAGTAHAQVKPEFVATHRSEVGESLDDFALRLREPTIESSMNVSGEICGEFRKVDDVYEITFYTIRKLQQCSYMRRKGLEYTGLTYHTHIFIGETNFHLLQAKLANPAFSEEDYAHPGYMASGRLVVFQQGRGTERRIRAR